MADRSVWNRTCVVCGDTFTRQRMGSRPPLTCSDECRKARIARQCAERYAAKHHNGLMRQFVCVVCGMGFERPHGVGQPPTICSDECHRERARRRASDWYYANPERVALQPSRQAAAVSIANAAYYEANRESEIQRALAYARGPGREVKRARDSARFALTRGAPTAERFTLDEIYERDGRICHLCSKPVDRQQATMDHVIPVTKGGPHTRANVKLAHRGCNTRKGNRERAMT